MPDRWKQLEGRLDRINDIPADRVEQKANSEAKESDSMISTQAPSPVAKAPSASVQAEKEGKSDQVSKPLVHAQATPEPEDNFSLETDIDFSSEDEGENVQMSDVKPRKRDTKLKGKKAKVSEPMLDDIPDTEPVLPDAVSDTNLDTEMKVVEPKIVRPKKNRDPVQEEDYKRVYATGPSSRARRAQLRAEHAGRDRDHEGVQLTSSWMELNTMELHCQEESRSITRREEREKKRMERRAEFETNGCITKARERDRVTPGKAKNTR